jgi:anti-sigma factor RsiW
VTAEAEDLVCVEVVELVTDYLEGALPDAQAQRLERHLGTCPGCTEYLEQLRAVAGSLRGVTDESFPAELRNSVIADFKRSRDP